MRVGQMMSNEAGGIWCMHGREPVLNSHWIQRGEAECVLYVVIVVIGQRGRVQ